MSRRATAWIAWSSWLLYVALGVLGLVLYFLASHPTDSPAGLRFVMGTFTAMALFLAFPTVGALVASRQPRNPIGWIFCAQGVALALLALSDAYARYTFENPGLLPGGVVSAWLSTLLWLPTIALGITLLLLVFPTGRLLSRRWRLWVVIAVGGTVINVVAAGLQPGPLYGPYSSYSNLFGISGTRALMEALKGIGFLLLLVGLLASIVSLGVRLRRSRATERQQLKWLVYDAALVGLIAPFFLGVESLTLVAVLGVFAYASIPVATGVAILKYNLYDIDVVINRTLVYGSLTAMLAFVYFGGVTATQAIFRTLTGQEQQPQLAIVVSTLVIAALFNPLRRRIQSFIDRRFYRKKYDAAKTLEAFAAKLRDETDLDALSDDLTSVVKETMQPTHVSLWLRPETAPKKSEQSN
jgi:hypothetical protein